MEANIEDKIKPALNDEPLEIDEKDKMSLKKPSKKWLIFLIIGIICLIGGVACLLIVFLKPPEEKVALTFPKIPSKVEKEETYSSLDGRALSDASLKNSLAYCIQIPNGVDGARPQVGLTEAGVIFEAIAEAGITRFAAIFQNPSTAVIGPIRSLRIYYLKWDTPFDCAIVHAGGSAEAMDAVRSGGYMDLLEDYAYMYRGTVSSRLWNNLFTTSDYLKQFGADYGYSSSDIQGFSFLTPKEANLARVNGMVEEKLVITEPTEKNTSTLTPEVSSISLRFGGFDAFNVDYRYDIASNTYLRSYADGDAHEVYKCSDGNLGEVNPEGNCDLVQMAPTTVVAMVVQEGKAPGGYYEDITVIGSGNVYIFQNGTVTRGTWSKGSTDEQIKFKDGDGKEIKLVPGQTIISAVPAYGSVEY